MDGKKSAWASASRELEEGSWGDVDVSINFGPPIAVLTKQLPAQTFRWLTQYQAMPRRREKRERRGSDSTPSPGSQTGLLKPNRHHPCCSLYQFAENSAKSCKKSFRPDTIPGLDAIELAGSQAVKSPSPSPVRPTQYQCHCPAA